MPLLVCPLHGPIVFHHEEEPYCPGCDRPPSGPRWWVHNLVAHPLLVLWPRVGVWLHDRTEPSAVRWLER